MQNLSEEYKALQLLAPQSVTTDVAASASNDIDVEKYNDDCLALLNVGAITGTPVTADITVMGALVATPTVFDQTLATFTQIDEDDDNKIAAVRCDLTGIKNIAPAVDVSASGTPNYTIGLAVLVKPFVEKASINSATPA